jgi:hypothetical protein
VGLQAKERSVNEKVIFEGGHVCQELIEAEAGKSSGEQELAKLRLLEIQNRAVHVTV